MCLKKDVERKSSNVPLRTWLLMVLSCPLPVLLTLYRDDALLFLFVNAPFIINNIVSIVCGLYLSFFLSGFLIYFYRERQKSRGAARFKKSFLFALRAGCFGVVSFFLYAVLRKGAYILAKLVHDLGK